jgi:hypothetical protein
VRKEDFKNTVKMLSRITFPWGSKHPDRFKDKIYDVVIDGEKYWYITEDGHVIYSLDKDTWVNIDKHLGVIELLENLF